MKLKKILQETNLWGKRKFGDKLPTVADYREAYNKKHNINEYDGIEKSVEKQLMNVHIGLGNAMRDILIDLTNQGHGDAEKIPNAKKANQQIEKVRQEFKKLCKLVKVTSFKP